MSLTGRLLVAAPALTEATFVRTVVLLLDHDADGALGVVVNRPTPVDVSEVLPSWQPYATTPGVLFQGGPVSLDSALGLASVSGGTEDEPIGWRRVAGALGLLDLDAPPEVVAGEMAALRIFAGYAGWGAGQLEMELAEGSWYVVAAQPDDAFSADPAGLWRAVLRRQTGELALLSTYPADPSLN
ncbi:MAG: putative transcriptional regulator [Actinomycetota bacterium]|jgi:putative transcriptional regulator|nr:putative transcriptional regulator [Actinomycetota bacterium]